MNELQTNGPQKHETGRINIHNRVKVLRIDSGLSRKELAHALGINHRTLGCIEREEYTVKLELAYRIVNFFELPLEAVFSQERLPPLAGCLPGGHEPGNGTRERL